MDEGADIVNWWQKAVSTAPTRLLKRKVTKGAVAWQVTGEGKSELAGPEEP